MIDAYIINYQYIVSHIAFITFKTILIITIVILILCLILLALGCLIKSQKIKSKSLAIIPALLLINIFLLSIPIIVVYFKNIV